MLFRRAEIYETEQRSREFSEKKLQVYHDLRSMSQTVDLRLSRSRESAKKLFETEVKHIILSLIRPLMGIFGGS